MDFGFFSPAMHHRFCVPKQDRGEVLPDMVQSRNLGSSQQKARGSAPGFTQPMLLGCSLLQQAGDAHVRTYIYMWKCRRLRKVSFPCGGCREMHLRYFWEAQCPLGMQIS